MSNHLEKAKTALKYAIDNSARSEEAHNNMCLQSQTHALIAIAEQLEIASGGKQIDTDVLKSGIQTIFDIGEEENENCKNPDTLNDMVSRMYLQADELLCEFMEDE